MLAVHGLDATVGVDLEGSGLERDEFVRLWGRCHVEDDQPASVVEAKPGESMELLTQSITRGLVTANIGRLLMLHAGCVADPKSGRALAYVAPGGTGKSTLTRQLGRRFGYVTDETVGIEPDTLRIHPYPKPVTLAASPGEEKIENSPDDLGLLPAPESVHLHRLVVLRRSATVTEPTFTDLDLLDAVGMLAPETSSLAQLAKPLHLLAQIHERLGCTLVEYSESADVVEWCLAQLEAP
ncbi:hypothetical protein [Aestuariimicrobium ganziense]|uniref:hypothetical protein n=1 Tax=Aestuariimicrobium ganziense TaxID=2773677 RepID=UPI0019426C39|nr:hypothetical protein [Aestuariimicrobium ganziense]